MCSTYWNATATTSTTTSTPAGPSAYPRPRLHLRRHPRDPPRPTTAPRRIPGQHHPPRAARTPSSSPAPMSAPSSPRADIAADDKRYRVEMCADCPDQSCPACQTHLRDAEAFDQIADRMLQTAADLQDPGLRSARTGPAATSPRAPPRSRPGPPASATSPHREPEPRTPGPPRPSYPGSPAKRTFVELRDPYGH